MVKAMTALMALVLCLTGCRTVRYVPMETVRTDTVYRAASDSVRREVRTVRMDSTGVRDSVVIVSDSSGRVLGRSEWHWRDHLVTVSDRSALQHVRSDSLSRLGRETSVRTAAVEKPLTRWQRFRLGAFWWLVAAVLSLAVYALRKPLSVIVRKLLF